MKQVSFIFLLFTFSICTGLAQKNSSQKISAANPMAPPPSNFVLKMSIVDSGHIRILYALNATDIRKPETYDDLQRLEIGTHISKYYSFFVFNSDSLASDWIKRNPHAGPYNGPGPMGAAGKFKGWSEYIYSEYFKNFSKNELAEYTQMPWLLEDYNSMCRESIPMQSWKIGDETQTIAGYLCQNATCKFRGRDYTAWFTTDIPISNGPWKFGGLPGLILKVYDKDKQYVFECVGIENYKKKYPIQIHKVFEQFKKLDRQRLWKIKKEAQENYYQLLQTPNSKGLVTSVKIIGSSSPNGEKLNPYNPLELE